MSLAGPPLASFLRGCTARLALADALVVMGNEASTGLPAHGEASPALTLPRQAADADSIISSIAQAYVSTHLRGTPACPYLPIDRKALRGRRETVTLLAEAGVDAGDLLTVDDLRPDQLPAACGFVLTDHNFPSALFAGIEEVRSPPLFPARPLSSPTLPATSQRVVEIIDHHHDAGQCPHVAGDARRVAFDNEKGSGIGSTCTLIAEELLRHPAHARDPLLSRLLLGVILVDTVNMSKAAKRATERDVAAVRALEADIAASLAPWSPTQSTSVSLDPVPGEPHCLLQRRPCSHVTARSSTGSTAPSSTPTTGARWRRRNSWVWTTSSASARGCATACPQS